VNASTRPTIAKYFFITEYLLESISPEGRFSRVMKQRVLDLQKRVDPPLVSLRKPHRRDRMGVLLTTVGQKPSIEIEQATSSYSFRFSELSQPI